MSASAFSQLWSITLVEEYEENVVSHIYRVGKEKNILIAILDQYDYTSFTL